MILFSSPVQIYKKSSCTTPGLVLAALALAKCLSFYVKVFNGMSKVLIDKLSYRWTGLIGKLCVYLGNLPYFFAYKTVFFFSFQNNPRNLDLSYKMDLDL